MSAKPGRSVETTLAVAEMLFGNLQKAIASVPANEAPVISVSQSVDGDLLRKAYLSSVKQREIRSRRRLGVQLPSGRE